MFEKKRKILDQLNKSFGKPKDESFNFESIQEFFRKKDKSAAYQVLSDKTCNDLDFEELFMFLDRTNSKIGQQFLYYKLRTIGRDPDNLKLQEELVEVLNKEDGLRTELQFQLKKLDKNEAYYITSLFQDEHVQKPSWYSIIPILSFTSIASILMLFFNLKFFFVLLVVFIINLALHYWNKRNLYQYLGSIPQLLKLNYIAKEMMKVKLLQKLDPSLSASIKTIDKVRNRMSFFRLEAKLESDAEMIFWAMLEFFKTLFLLEPLLLFGVLKQLDTKRKEIESVFSFVGNIDFLISIASLRSGLEMYCIPEITIEKKILESVNIYHPLIPECIPNSLFLKDKSILLTGSNMSGKTSFIRAIGINVICALTINTCFASKFALPRMKIFSAIRISDDLMNDKSYYFEEVLTIKEMITQSQTAESNLFLLDEIFKGTNTIERISAGKAVLSYLSNNCSMVFVSTHDIELADLLKDSFELYHFSEIVGNKTVDFDYKLKEGKLKNRNAIRILEVNEYPAEIIKEAMELAKMMDTRA